MKVILVWILCGALAVPICAKAFREPLYLGNSIMTVAAGPFGLMLGILVLLVDNRNCIANCKERS